MIDLSFLSPGARPLIGVDISSSSVKMVELAAASGGGKVGFRFVFGQRSMVLLLVIISALYNVGVSAFVFILPVYAKEFLQVGPVQLGWLWSALGVGMLAASTWLAWKKHSDMRGRLHIVVSGMTIGGSPSVAWLSSKRRSSRRGSSSSWVAVRPCSIPSCGRCSRK